jgi:hypothetical protein
MLNLLAHPGDQSRTLSVGDRVYWQSDHADPGTVTEKHWAGVTIKRDNRMRKDVRAAITGNHAARWLRSAPAPSRPDRP